MHTALNYYVTRGKTPSTLLLWRLHTLVNVLLTYMYTASVHVFQLVGGGGPGISPLLNPPETNEV